MTRTRNTWFAATRSKPLNTPAGLHAVLPYGWTLRRGDESCTSATTGVTRTNVKTRHGFFVSRGFYRLF